MITSKTFESVKRLVAKRDVLISSHGYDELAEDHLSVREILESLPSAIVIEDYPDFGKGPCCLLLQVDSKDEPVHTVWGIPKEKSHPAVLITAYRPDPERWSEDFQRRL